MSYIQKEIKDSVLILSLDKPGEKVNTLDEAMMEQFFALLEEVDSNEHIKGVVLISRKKDNFIAGADIEMFKAKETAEEMKQLSLDGHQILNRIEDSKNRWSWLFMAVVWEVGWNFLWLAIIELHQSTQKLF